MKNLFITAILLFVFTATQAQIETKIIGKWKVTSVEANGKLNEKQAKQLDALKKAKLEFTADHHAKFKQLFSSYHIPNAYWEYDKQQDVISFYDWSDRNVVRLRLWYDELENGGFMFYIDETPFILHVARDEK